MAKRGSTSKRRPVIIPEMVACPQCRSINSVRVAGVYEYPYSPRKWFCKCGNCGKSFYPKTKEKELSNKNSVSCNENADLNNNVAL